MEKREAQFGEDVKFESEIIEKCAGSTPTAAIIHFCNLALKKKLLNKLVYKFSETIFAPEEEPEEESKQMIVTTENEIEQNTADKSIYGFKLLWFTM